MLTLSVPFYYLIGPIFMMFPVVMVFIVVVIIMIAKKKGKKQDAEKQDFADFLREKNGTGKPADVSGNAGKPAAQSKPAYDSSDDIFGFGEPEVKKEAKPESNGDSLTGKVVPIYGKAADVGEYNSGDYVLEVPKKKTSTSSATVLRNEGDKCLANGDGEAAAEHYYSAYKLGDKLAACKLGELYLNGYGVIKDEKRAVKLFESAQELPRARYLLGHCYYNCAGVMHDFERAASLFASAEELPEARLALAECYIDGLGVKKDTRKAISYLSGLADENDVAAYKLAEIYYAGNGVKKNNTLAREYWTMAAEKGNLDAKECLKIYFGI